MVFINILTNNKLNAENMKIKLFLLGFGLALSTLGCYASDIPDFYFYDCESKFSNLTGYCQESLDVTIKLPKGFKDMALMGHYMQKSKAGTIGGGSSFRAIAKSADGECILLIPDEKSEAKSFFLSTKTMIAITKSCMMCVGRQMVLSVTKAIFRANIHKPICKSM